MATRSETDSGYRFAVAAERDDAELRAALRGSAMPAWVAATVEREPSYFAANDLPGHCVTVTARESHEPGELAGLCSCAFFPVHLNGRPVEACYLGSLRLREKFRARPGLLKRGFEALPRLVPAAAGASLLFTSIASDNAPARRILEAGARGMPRYTLLGEMATCALGVGCARGYGLLERAKPSDAAELAAFHNEACSGVQLSPVLSEDWLSNSCASGRPMIEHFLIHRREGRIAACIAVWDQRAYRQIVVRGYRQPLRALRGAHNAMARLRGQPQLPPVGGRLEQVFLAFAALDPALDDGDFFVRLVREALLSVRMAGADGALIGLSPNSARYAALRRALSCYVYKTRIESVALAGATPPEISGFVQPEVALL